MKSQAQLVLSGSFAVFLCSGFLVFHYVVLESFKELEESKAKVDIQRCIEALDREAHHLGLAIHDWASYDETYEYILDRNKEYELFTFGENVFETTDFDLIYYIDAKGMIVWSGAASLDDGESTITVSFPQEPWPRDYALNMVDKQDISHSGIILLNNETIMVIAAAKILTTDVKGPCRGTVVMGRLLTKSVLEKLANQTHVDMQA